MKEHAFNHNQKPLNHVVLGICLTFGSSGNWQSTLPQRATSFFTECSASTAAVASTLKKPQAKLGLGQIYSTADDRNLACIYQNPRKYGGIIYLRSRRIYFVNSRTVVHVLFTQKCSLQSCGFSVDHDGVPARSCHEKGCYVTTWRLWDIVTTYNWACDPTYSCPD